MGIYNQATMRLSERHSTTIILLVGAILRIRQYLSMRSLWADEAMLALNIVNRDLVSIFQPLDYDQGAPLGFLLAQKLVNLLLGRHELVLRLIPLVVGLTSLWLFYQLAQKNLQGTGLMLALGLFTLNPALIYYTSEAKQYIMDVAVVIGLMWLANPLFRATESMPKNMTRLAIGGVIALWFSHAALFALVGIGSALLIQSLSSEKMCRAQVLGMGILWLANLGLLYFINLRHLNQNDYLAAYWAEGFLRADWNWLTTYLPELIKFQFELTIFPWLALVLIALGWFGIFRNERVSGLAILLTWVFALVASGLRLYPVSGRLALFLIPLGILALGKAIEMIQQALKQRVASTALTIVVGAYLLFNATILSIQNFITPKYYEHIRPTMSYLGEAWRAGDTLFVTAWAEPAFRFYAPFYGLERIAIVASEQADYENPQQVLAHVDSLVGQKRVWVLFSHVYDQGDFNERDALLVYLDQLGEQTRTFQRSGTSVYLFLYDLSR